ncbi:MAG TPA: ATP-binding cassette domain-containing protein [Firmicutes bacterium]|jgi:putative ABC transport system ATP-binding protein|nr:ATP-binding cassette domain-containing protein [Bacillota bacterium]
MLVIEKLNKTFELGGGTTKRAIKDLDFQAQKGDFVTIVGSNGAGKSTLLNLVAGVYSPDSGKIFINGIDITDLPEHKRAKFIGRVFQDPMMGTASTMTLEENLAMALKRGQKRNLKLGVKGNRDKFRNTLSKLDLGLEDRLTDQVRLLSGGQRQSLTLMMATLNAPPVLLLDEHTAALDPKTASCIIDMTKEIVVDNELTVLMVTHNLQQALEVGNRTIMMHDGEIVLDLFGKEREDTSVDTLLEEFSKVKKERFLDDRALLA